MRAIRYRREEHKLYCFYFRRFVLLSALIAVTVISLINFHFTDNFSYLCIYVSDEFFLFDSCNWITIVEIKKKKMRAGIKSKLLYRLDVFGGGGNWDIIIFYSNDMKYFIKMSEQRYFLLFICRESVDRKKKCNVYWWKCISKHQISFYSRMH